MPTETKFFDLNFSWYRPSKVLLSAVDDVQDMLSWYVKDEANSEPYSFADAVSKSTRIVGASRDIVWSESLPMATSRILSDFSIVEASDSHVGKLVRKYGFLHSDGPVRTASWSPPRYLDEPYYVEEVDDWIELINLFSTVIRGARILHLNEEPESFKNHLLRIHSQQSRRLVVMAALPGIDTSSSEAIAKHFSPSRTTVAATIERLVDYMVGFASFCGEYRRFVANPNGELVLAPRDLYSALTIRLSEIVSGNRKLYLCPVCEEYFDHGKHTDRLYCSDACKQKAHRQRVRENNLCNNGATTDPATALQPKKRGRPKGSKKRV